MSTARNRQINKKMIECSEAIKSVGNHILDGNVSFHDTDDLIKVIKELTETLSHVTFIDAWKVFSETNKETP
jgi:hypothetical protein